MLRHVSLCYATGMRCCNPLQCSACNAMRCSAMQCEAMQCDECKMQCDAMESDAVQASMDTQTRLSHERHQPVAQIHFPRLGARLQLHKFIENQRCPATNCKLIAFGVLPGASWKLMHIWTALLKPFKRESATGIH